MYLMKMASVSGSLSFSILSTLTVAALMCSFGLHAVQISHEHPGHAHKESSSHQDEGADLLFLGEYMHLSDKKLLLDLAFPLLSVTALLILFGSWRELIIFIELLSSTYLRRCRNIALSLYNYLEYYFSNGLLHPKTF